MCICCQAVDQTQHCLGLTWAFQHQTVNPERFWMFRLYRIRHWRAIYETCDVWKHSLSVIQNEQDIFINSWNQVFFFYIVDCYRLTWFGLHGWFSLIVFNFSAFFCFHLYYFSSIFLLILFINLMLNDFKNMFLFLIINQ